MAKKPQRQSYERKIKEPTAITPVEYSGLQAAYDHFDRVLFDGELSNVDAFFTYQRKPHSDGYFAPDRFSSRNGNFNAGELALNPDCFCNKSDEQICQTLVQLMVQVWQHSRGTLPSRGYHDGEWAEAMKRIGLYPSSTGAPGGSETGQRMSSYILPDGAFSRAYAKLAVTGWKLNLQSAPRVGGKKKKTDDSKTPFFCAVCDWRMWGKPDSEMTCTRCVTQAMAIELGEESPDAIALAERYRLKMRHAPTAVVADEAASASLPLFESPPSYEPTPPPSYDETPLAPVATAEAAPIKRNKGGRPKGSKNKPKRGRRKGSKNKRAVLAQSYEPSEQPTKRKPGRPPGSRSRPKPDLERAAPAE